MQKMFYTPQDLSEIMGICYAKALAFIKNSGINYTQINRTYLVSSVDFDEFIKKNKKVKI